jgi:integrating conjugative element protein (TIGR03756 family)
MCWLFPSSAMASDIDDATPSGSKKIEIFDLITDTMDLSCIDYKIKGMCFWLVCKGPFCSIRTSTVVSHYNPDVIVETVSNRENYPLTWLTKPMSKVTDPAAKALNHGIDVGTGVRGSAGSPMQKNFYDVNVYGNPALLAYRNIVGSMMKLSGFCDSDIVPMNPYFVSTIDPEWRLGLLEMPLLAIPSNFSRKLIARNPNDTSGMIGSVMGEYGDYIQSGERYGHVFPRIGSLINPNRYTGSMVIAQRAADVVTTSVNGHISQKLPVTSGSAKVWAPVAPREGEADTAKWQRNYPRGRKECKEFPADGSVDFKYSESDFSPTHNYLYTLWRRYECCARKGKFLYRM